LLCKQLPIDQVQHNIFAFDKTNRIEKVSLCMIVIFFNLIDILFFADDITLIANSEQELNTLLDITSKFADKWNLKFNDTKSKVMVVGKRIDRKSMEIR
jgi:hypothetical protein